MELPKAQHLAYIPRFRPSKTAVIKKFNSNF